MNRTQSGELPPHKGYLQNYHMMTFCCIIWKYIQEISEEYDVMQSSLRCYLVFVVF